MLTIHGKKLEHQMSLLKGQLNSILDLFERDSTIYYIDYPVHTNVGDLLINAGTEQFFAENAIRIHKRLSVFDVKEVAHLQVGREATFLCHGGGNFGDLYFEHQHIRELLLDLYPDSRIIFLPQSIHFSSLEKQKNSFEKIARHANCHILLRDQESLDALHAAGVTHAFLMPDMAHQLWGSLKPHAAPSSKGDMHFLRKDIESAPIPSELQERFAQHPVDWSNIVSLPHRIYTNAIHKLLVFGSEGLPEHMKVSLWYKARDYMVEDAVTYFSGYEKVYTNRLHAMLLALLLSKEVIIFDNSYNKLSRYAHTWLAGGIEELKK